MAEEHECEEAVKKLQDAIQNFINVHSDQPMMLDQAVVVWEEVGFDENGVAVRGTQYCIPTDNFSMAMAIGLCDIGGAKIRRDLIAVDVRNDRRNSDG